MRLIDFLFPQTVKCIFCGIETEGIGICKECYSQLPFISGKTCSLCGGHLIGEEDVCIECKSHEIFYNQNFNVFDYVDNIQASIIEFKQNGSKYIGEVFADIMLEKFKSLERNFDIIIPVPIHENRLKERGFNQSEILSSKIKIYYGKVDEDLLERVKDTPHQTGLSRENRELNLEVAFVLKNKSKVKDKDILLIDDIYTTGSTLNECAKTLFKAGAKNVCSLCLARGIVRKDNILDN